MTKALVRTSDDLPKNHWMARQLPPGTSLRAYAEDEAISVLTSAVQEALDDAGITRAEIAEQLGTTRSYVSQVLNGSTNMTLKTLGALCWVAGRQVTELRSVPLGVDSPQELTARATIASHGAINTGNTVFVSANIQMNNYINNTFTNLAPPEKVEAIAGTTNTPLAFSK